jgi:phosphoribosylanthranilate isomerase
MFQVKICGITTPEDALLAAEAGADAIGLNFHEQSPRYVSPSKAREIVAALRKLRPAPPQVVGVFVNNSLEQMWQIAEAADVFAFQLHGDEPPELFAELSLTSNVRGNSWMERIIEWLGDEPRFPVIRAFRCQSSSLAAIADYLEQSAGLIQNVAADLAEQKKFGRYEAVLLDAHQPGSYGGTGQVVDWHMVREQRDKLLGLPIILAGGLTPENVAEAIATAHPDAVDVASGVESTPGKKDPAKVRAFVAAAKQAFAGQVK